MPDHSRRPTQTPPRRAKTLECLSNQDVHGDQGSEISVKPWGERSFYAQDRWQNPLCFVEAGTIYPGCRIARMGHTL